MTDPLAPILAHGLNEKILVGGQWRAPHGTVRCAVIDPATEAPMLDIVLGDQQDVEDAVAAARAAFPAWSATAPGERAAILSRMHALVIERAELFAHAISREMGAAIAYARVAHVPFAAEHLRVAAENLATYPFLHMRGTTAIQREAIGVAALITPWNWPLYQVTAKVAGALAAGCTMVLKPSELSPITALLFAQVTVDAGLPAGVFNLVNGTGPEVGEAMVRHREVDVVSLTGSTRAGVIVAQAAAETVKRVALELGGKSPNVILPDADMAKAVTAGVAAGMRNVGQSCSAPTRMIVPRDRLAQVEEIAIAAVNGFVVGNPADPATTHGPIANRAQFERVQHMIGVGLAEGARLICGGPGRPDGLETGYFVRPTIFSDVRPDMAIAQEEIFGPVLAIIPYDDVEEAIEIANASIYGLGGHVQGGDVEQARAVARRIRSGQIQINNPAWDPNAPFGGYRMSGNGREFGIEGMEEFLEIKSILGYGNA